MHNIHELLTKGDATAIAAYMKENDLIIVDGKILPAEEKKEWAKGQISFYDQRQQAR